jgi:hypothetical protein
MRQRLTNRKNQKLRKVRALYGIDVQVLYRRDILRLARRWAFARLERAAGATSAGKLEDLRIENARADAGDRHGDG